MDGEASFIDLVTRVRAGDEQAAAELLRRYEPHVRRVVRVRLTSPALRRQMDTTDICQSVMADFFVRAALGQFEFEQPEQLIKLLATMARNKIVNHAHKQQAARRDVRRLERASIDEMSAPGREETPSEIVAGRELLAKFQSRLSDEERYVADQRADGRPWSEIAAELGTNVDAVRKRLARALDRVSQELGLETLNDEPS